MKLPTLPWKEKGKPTCVAVYSKTNLFKKYYMLVTDHHVDTINNANARKPLIDHNYIIVELGIGESFIETWSHKYKINKPQVVNKYG